MTSEQECFVYITLPGQTKAVTAGKFRLTTDTHRAAVGEFVYRGKYLARPDCVELDPVELRLRTRLYTTVRLNGMFGALRDSSPDYWGRKLIEKRLGVAAELSELEYMLNSPDDRAGALGCGLGVEPPAPIRLFNRTIDLETLMDLADRIVAAETDPTVSIPAGSDAEQAEQLIRAGTSMGGARPKATVEDDDSLWLAKFPQRTDRWNNPRIEHAMLRLATECGITAAHSKMMTVGDKDVLLVQRFDRRKAEDGWLRTRMISGLTMLDADEGERAKWSYLLLADEVRRSCAGQAKELLELYRRVVFNTLISNTDDHPRNHAFLARDRGWSLSPAYDLTPTPSVAYHRYLAMSFGDQGRAATKANLISQCARFLVDPAGAEKIIDDMTEMVRSGWYRVMRGVGVSERDCELIRSAFVPESFGEMLLLAENKVPLWGQDGRNRP